MKAFFGVVILFLTTVTLAIPKPDDAHEKIVRAQEHFQNPDHHDKGYDHEAFLGEDAVTFDQLSPEESRRRLGIIVNKIDADSNGFVSHEELKDWITLTQKRYIREDVNRQWEQHNPDHKKTIAWDDYKKAVYGYILGANEEVNNYDGFNHQNMIDRDRRRWSAADLDADDELTKEEFMSFLHPEEVEHMKDLIVLETLEDIDKDKDGKVSLEEYIGDMYNGEEGEAEPEWVRSEREQFSAVRDKDGDNYLNLEEVRNWISPPDFDHAEAESRHLIYEADSDADQQLTKEEILNKYDLFVGSQATDFGDALARHDEF